MLESPIRARCTSVHGVYATCSPIGEYGKETYERTEGILEHIIEPVAGPMNYKVLPAHKDTRPGLITSQIVQHLVDSELVIADLSGENPK